MSHDERSDEDDGVEAFVQRLIAAGYDDRQTIIDSAGDYLADEDLGDALIDSVPGMVDRAIAAQLDAQKSWPSVTDCDRLDAAFTRLEASGIVARQNFTCCQTCGFAEIGAEIEDVIETGVAVRGMTFFHQQDTESAVAGHGVYLSYGAWQDQGDAAAIAREVVAALHREGLKTKWDGTTAQRVEVLLNWQRRYPGAPPVQRVDPATGKRDLWALFGLRRPKQ
jgi:hypothetical protein